MTVHIRPCRAADLAALLARDLPFHLAYHHRERFALQADGSGVYLLAWLGERNVGRATLYARSTYDVVRQTHPDAAEINALEAFPPGAGTGTALITAAETQAEQLGHPRIGIAVEPGNPAARRLYERLGYAPWGGPQVIDEWTERHRDGSCRQHRDRCDYLIKTLPSRR